MPLMHSATAGRGEFPLISASPQAPSKPLNLRPFEFAQFPQAVLTLWQLPAASGGFARDDGRLVLAGLLPGAMIPDERCIEQSRREASASQYNLSALSNQLRF